MEEQRIFKLMNDKYSHPEKFLEKHVKEVKFISNKLIELFNLSNETEKRVKGILNELILFHDLGKIHSKFQQYLNENNKSEHISHSLLSSIIYFMKNKESIILKRDYIKSLIFFLILKHHSTLKIEYNYGVIKNLVDTDNEIIEILKKVMEDKNIDKDYIKRILPLLKSTINIVTNDTNNLENYLITLFAFGIFLFADRLSASIIEDWKDEEELEKIIEELDEIKVIKSAYSEINYEKFKKFIEELQEKSPKNEINKLRTEAFKEVEKNFEKNENFPIYKITLPTGLGKTYTGLNIALKLNKKLKRPIIYSLPFLSIIEQNYERIKNIFDNEVGKFHHLTVFSDNEENEKIRDFLNFELKPITITTLIQVFHSIFTNNRNWIMKFPFIATSIWLIDETQNLPIGCFKAFEEILLKMNELFGTKFIFMSATQPYLFPEEEFKDKVKELVEDKKYYYCRFNRYKIKLEDDVFKLDENNKWVLDLEKLSEKMFKKLKEKNKVGIIVNKVNDSVEIFNYLNNKLKFQELNEKEVDEIKTNIKTKLEREMGELKKLENKINEMLKKLEISEEFKINDEFVDLKKLIKNNIKKFEFNDKKFYVVYLSANLINLEKKIRVLLLEELMKNNVLIISTQVIEAGVDIGLEVMFRFIAPLDSLVQSAGRVNRNGFNDEKGEFIIIGDFEGEKDRNLYSHVYSNMLIEKTKKVIKEVKNEKEIIDPKRIDGYFKEVRNSKNDETCVKCENTKNFVEDAIKKFNFECIGNFSLLDSSITYDLILDLDFQILIVFKSIYEELGTEKWKKEEKKEEKKKYLREIKKLRKIEEFFKATRVGKINVNENKDEKLQDFYICFEELSILKIFESIKGKKFKESNYKELINFESLLFKKEQKQYFKTKIGKISYYTYFGFDFSKDKDEINEEIAKCLKENNNGFIID